MVKHEQSLEKCYLKKHYSLFSSKFAACLNAQTFSDVFCCFFSDFFFKTLGVKIISCEAQLNSSHFQLYEDSVCLYTSQSVACNHLQKTLSSLKLIFQLLIYKLSSQNFLSVNVCKNINFRCYKLRGEGWQVLHLNLCELHKS